MHHIQTQIAIDAPAERVWSILLDFPEYPSWNPFIRSIDGPAEVSEKLNVLIQPAGKGGMRFRPAVLVMQPQQELRWKGKILWAGFFAGEHYFKLEPRVNGGVIFHHGEIFSGVLVPFLKGSLEGDTKRGFDAMNAALKRKAEEQEAAHAVARG